MTGSNLATLGLAIAVIVCTPYQSSARKAKPELEKRIKTTISKANLKLFSSRFWITPQAVEARGFGRNKSCAYRVSYRMAEGSGENREAMISLIDYKKKNHLTAKMDNALSSAYIERMGFMSNYTIRDVNGQTYSSKTIDRDAALYKQELKRKGVEYPRLVFDIAVIFADFQTLSWKPGETVAAVYDTDNKEFGTYSYLGSGVFQGQGIAVLDFTVSSEFPASNQGKVVARLALDHDTMLPVLYVAEMKTYFLKLEQTSCN